MALKTLQVVPNPYRVLDANGTPSAVYPCHRAHAPNEYVGAKLEIQVTSKGETIAIARKDKRGNKVMETHQSKPERSVGAFVFSTDPVELPATGTVGTYYRAGIRDGALIPANEATARACGLPFEPVDVVLQRERTLAAEAFKREHGDVPAWAKDIKSAPTSALS